MEVKLSEGAFTNNGPLLSPEKVADLPTSPQWACDEVALKCQTAIKDALEKHGELLHTDATEPQTKYFIVNPVLSSLGYVFSVSESISISGDAKARVDYTLFSDSEAFDEAVSFRGGQAFFRSAIALCQATVWNESLDLSEDAELAAHQPTVVVDVLLRSTGVDYGIVTNGKKWRLVNRATSDTYSTYVEFDIEELAQADIESFKHFYLLFGKSSLVRDNEGQAFLDQFVA